MKHPGIISDGALALLDSAAGKFSPTATGRAAFKTYWLQRLHITNTQGTADFLNFKLPFALDQVGQLLAYTGHISSNISFYSTFFSFCCSYAFTFPFANREAPTSPFS